MSCLKTWSGTWSDHPLQSNKAKGSSESVFELTVTDGTFSATRRTQDTSAVLAARSKISIIIIIIITTVNGGHLAIPPNFGN